MAPGAGLEPAGLSKAHELELPTYSNISSHLINHLGHNFFLGSSCFLPVLIPCLYRRAAVWIWECINEASAPKISAFGGGCCRAADSVARRLDTSLSTPIRAPGGAISCRRG